MVGSGLVSGSRLVFRVVSLTLVFHISNITSVGISNRVGHNLGTAIGKSNTVFTSGGISITVLVGLESSTTVVISNSVSILIDSRAIISRLMVSRGVVGSGFVSRGRVDNRLVHNRGRVVDRSGLVDGGGVVDRGMVNLGVVGSMHGSMSRGMSMSDILLLIVVLMDFIGGSSRLGGYLGVVVSMSTVDGGRDRGGIAVFDNLVRVLVGSSQSQDGEDSDEGLK